MSYHNAEPVSKQLTLLVGLPIVGIMAFSLLYSFYQNILFQKHLGDIEEKNRNIALEIEKGYLDLEYYRSDQYKDKIAKESLNLFIPGEYVLVIPEESESPPVPARSSLQLNPTEHQEAAFRELLRQIPVIEHWKLFLFHRKNIEEMKRSL